MAHSTKYITLNSDIKTLFPILKTRKTLTFAYGFTFAFVSFTLFLAFCPSPNTYSPFFTNIFTSTATTISSSNTSRSTNTTSQSPPTSSKTTFTTPFENQTPTTRKIPSDHTAKSPDHVLNKKPSSVTNHTQVSGASHEAKTNQSSNGVAPASKVSGLSPNKNLSSSSSGHTEKAVVHSNDTASLLKTNQSSNGVAPSPKVTGLSPNKNLISSGHTEKGVVHSNDTASLLKTNQSSNGVAPSPKVSGLSPNKNLSSSEHTEKGVVHSNNTASPLKTNQSSNGVAPSPKVSGLSPNKNLSSSGHTDKGVVHSNDTASPLKKQKNGSNETDSRVKDEMIESLIKCDFYDGEWIKDDSYPLYEPGSCNIIDEQFNCIQNGRTDNDYQKYKWKPKGCSLPRLDGNRMLEMLRGKKVIFVGDSINRNMWESLICILRNSVKDKSKVYEANGRVHFRGEASYSFIFQDYNFSVELFVSPFLVQEWEVQVKNGSKKETLRLDLVGKSSVQYKNADIIIFNTGHWWTHDKTAKGKDYYQEGSHVYNDLNVLEAFRRAITTWSRWIDANINPSKSMVFFRGYSASHFSGGQWNSGGQCNSETVPIKNEKYLREYPPKMKVVEKVLKYMKTPVTYLNVTKMTDFRKDGHPSIYRKQNLSTEEMKSPLRYQDCSHWCLPGVPDAWNEILYAELLLKQYQKQHQHK